MLSSLSKLLGKLVARQVFSYLNCYGILYKNQYGFRKGHSTSHPILHFLDKIYSSLNKNDPEYTLGVFLDLKKAFDTVNFEILIKKMEHYGFRGTSKRWFQNYLSDRVQYVTIDGSDSSPQKMLCGVPQGSVLGPLLFLIFINDLPNAKDFFSLLFADDTTFQMSSNNLPDLFSLANSELAKASLWFKANKLTLNVSKTKYILFRSKKMHVDLSNLKLNIGNEQIDRIGTDCKEKFFKFVGIYLDEHLSWDHHINHVGNKVASGSYAISTAKKILPTKIRLTMYNSFFRSYCDYGMLAWGGVKPSKLKKIAKL